MIVTSMQLTISSRRDIAVLQKESSALEGEEDVKNNPGYGRVLHLPPSSAAARQSERLLGDDAALDFARAAIDGGCGRMAMGSLDESQTVLTFEQRVRGGHIHEVGRISQEGLRRKQLGHRAVCAVWDVIHARPEAAAK